MLVLTRRIDEAVKIGNDIEVKVLEIRANHIRLGFTAPSDVILLRTELCEAAATNPKPERNQNLCNKR